MKTQRTVLSIDVLAFVLLLFHGGEYAVTQEKAGPGNPLDGTWGIYSARVNGQDRIAPRASLRYEFDGDRLSMHLPGKTIRMKIRSIAGEQSGSFDIGTPPRYERYIYKIKDGVLHLCVATTPIERPDDFITKAGDNRSLYVLRKMDIEKLGKPITDSEFDRIIETLTLRDLEIPPQDVFDLDTMWERAIEGLMLSDKVRLSFINGYRSSASAEADSPVRQMADEVSLSARYDYIKRVDSAGLNGRATMRVIHNDGSINYHEIVVDRNCFGYAKIVDFRNFTVGEWTTELVRRVMLPGLARSSTDVEKHANAFEKDILRHEERLNELASLLARKDTKEVLRVYAELPISLQKQKYLLNVLLQMTIQQAEHRNYVLELCQKFHPKFDGLEITLLQNHIADGDLAKARLVVDLIENRVEGDPYLNEIRAELSLIERDFESAEKFAAAAIDSDKTCTRPYFSLIEVALHREQYSKAVELIDALRKQTGNKELTALQSMENYQQFANSAEYRKWQLQK